MTWWWRATTSTQSGTAASVGEERARGDLWAARMVAQGGWVQKLPASVTAGIPDWLHARPGGLRLVEAKTRAACAEEGTPWEACSGAQRFILSMVARYAGSDCARVLVLGEEGYQELSLQEARRPDWGKRFIRRQQAYV